MRTSKRIALTMILPAVIIGLVAAVALQVFYYFKEGDSEPIDNAQQQPERLAAIYSRMRGEAPPFSEEAKRQEVATLRDALDRLQTTQSDTEIAEGQTGEIADQREALQQSLQELEQADSENWERLREEAYTDLATYAESVTAAVADTPQAPAQ